MPNKKVKVEQCKQLSIYPLIRNLNLNSKLPKFISWDDDDSIGLQLISKRNSKFIELYYKQIGDNGEEINLDYEVKLTRTKSHITGYRYWFTCPLLREDGKGCGRRVAILYQPPDESYFGCRDCYDLTYESKSRKYPLPYNPFEAKEQDRKFKRKLYAGVHTKRYAAFLERVEKRHSAHLKKVVSMNEKYFKGVIPNGLRI